MADKIGLVGSPTHADLMLGIMEAAAKRGLRPEILTLEYRKAPEPPDIPCRPRERTYIPARPGKHKRRTR